MSQNHSTTASQEFGCFDIFSDEVKQIADMGYWSGEAIRILGDGCEKEHAKVKNEYRDVSFYILANVFENGTDELRIKILMNFKSDKQKLKRMLLVSYQ